MGRVVSPGAIYTALTRLERSGICDLPSSASRQPNGVASANATTGCTPPDNAALRSVELNLAPGGAWRAHEADEHGPISLRPPRLARALALRSASEEMPREVVVGDLDQEFAEAIVFRRPARKPRGDWNWRQTMASLVALRRGTGGAPPGPLKGPRRLPSVSRPAPRSHRPGLRVLRRSPGYAAISVLSLAIGIGANTTIFSVVRQLLVMPLPVERPDNLRLGYWSPRHKGPLGIVNICGGSFTHTSGTNYRSNFTYAQFVAMQGSISGSANLAGVQFLRASRVGRGAAAAGNHRLLVSGNFFGAVRPPFALGRGCLTGTTPLPHHRSW